MDAAANQVGRAWARNASVRRARPSAARDQAARFVIVDSLDAATEGVGEQDSGKPSRALAPLLDVAHREGGPAVLAFGNTIKSGSHSRGSGIVEDRADICYEVRDATEFTPSGSQPWWLELPPAGRGAWAERAGRRTQRTCYRLAFICTKYREGEEPTPFVVEIDLTRECWAVRDVTDEVNQAGHQAREAATQAQEAQRADVVVKLVAELERRQTAGEPVLLHTAAVEWLRQVHAMTRKAARHLLATEDGRCWRFQPAVGEDEHRRSRSG